MATGPHRATSRMLLLAAIIAAVCRPSACRVCDMHVPSDLPAGFEAHRVLLEWSRGPIAPAAAAAAGWHGAKGGPVTCTDEAHYCMVLWSNRTDGNADGTHTDDFVVKGCWKGQSGACDVYDTANGTLSAESLGCVATREAGGRRRLEATHYFCCCQGDRCNARYAYRPDLRLPSRDADDLPLLIADTLRDGGDASGETYIYELSVFFVLLGTLALGVSGVAYALWRHNTQLQQRAKNAALLKGALGRAGSDSDLDALISANADGSAYSLGTNLAPEQIDMGTLRLDGVPIGRGRYGEVFRAVDARQRHAAVKVFRKKDAVYFWNEVRVLSSAPILREAGRFVVQFLAASEGDRFDEADQDMPGAYWLITSLAPAGSLHDRLKTHTVSFDMATKLGSDVAHALAFLHAELDIRTGVTIAHRDVNSRNVLVLHADDGNKCRAVLCDFGFALVTKNDKDRGNAQVPLPEVGTPRYMAPEVLDGSVNLRDSTGALKQIDVYGLSLVLWELVNRCDDVHYLVGEPVPQYMPPYGVELGAHPTVYQMHACVVKARTRPRLPAALFSHAHIYPALRSLRDVIEDCWDHDAEARLAAMCAYERLKALPTFRHVAETPTPHLAPVPVAPCAPAALSAISELSTGGDNSNAPASDNSDVAVDAAHRAQLNDCDDNPCLERNTRVHGAVCKTHGSAICSCSLSISSDGGSKFLPHDSKPKQTVDNVQFIKVDPFEAAASVAAGALSQQQQQQQYEPSAGKQCNADARGSLLRALAAGGGGKRMQRDAAEHDAVAP